MILFLVNINGTIGLLINWDEKEYSMRWLGKPFSRFGSLLGQNGGNSAIFVMTSCDFGSIYLNSDFNNVPEHSKPIHIWKVLLKLYTIVKTEFKNMLPKTDDVITSKVEFSPF